MDDNKGGGTYCGAGTLGVRVIFIEDLEAMLARLQVKEGMQSLQCWECEWQLGGGRHGVLEGEVGLGGEKQREARSLKRWGARYNLLPFLVFASALGILLFASGFGICLRIWCLLPHSVPTISLSMCLPFTASAPLVRPHLLLPHPSSPPPPPTFSSRPSRHPSPLAPTASISSSAAPFPS